MKTPREILLARHRPAEPKLDAIRQQALAALQGGPRTATAASGPRNGWKLGALVHQAWFELVWPSRRAWGGLAAMWVAIVAVNVGLKVETPAGPHSMRTPTPELARAFQEQRRLLAELLPPTANPPAETPPANPRPRSERALPWKRC